MNLVNMCEQTEINYLDGDIVWVKLGSYWWPGQVICLEKLPEDIQVEFQKKPIIAAVKFFQEDSFEFVKNYQQIYKYNCTQKEDFIRKGLDKYRAKSKDGSNYMDKFPDDVKTAELLTDGDPNILLNEKFNPEEKPDISGLFGEKKIPKKKRNRDDMMKKGDGDIRRKITHPRFLQESDHEIRIRQQPQNLPSTSANNSLGGIYPCHICGFTATRVNVIICHLKNHRLNNESASTVKSKLKNSAQSKAKQTNVDSPKRKYTRKSMVVKCNNETSSDSGKRKYPKQLEKPNKKTKSDPELRDRLLADWNVDSDEDDTGVPLDNSSKDNIDGKDLFQEANKLLQETDNLSKFSTMKDVLSNIEKVDADENDFKKSDISSSKKNRQNFHFKKSSVISNPKEKDDKNSRLSCFDFEEEDISEPNMSSVRKIPRGLGNKSISIKKEIIKEFEMNRALKHDEEKIIRSDENIQADFKKNVELKMLEEKVQIIEVDEDNKAVVVDENKKSEKGNQNNHENKKFEKTADICETQVEILEIFEVEKEDEEKNKNSKDISKFEVEKDNSVKLKDEHVFEKLEVQNNDFIKTKVIRDNVAEIKSDNYNVTEVIIQKDFTEVEAEREKLIKEVQEQIVNQNQEVKDELTGENKNKSNETKYRQFVLLEKGINNAEFIKGDCSSTRNITLLGNKNVSVKNFLENEANSADLTSEVKNQITLSKNSTFEINNFDIEVSSTFNSTLQASSKVEGYDSGIEKNLNSTVKKRRGRPRKSLESSEEVLSENDCSKLNDSNKIMETSEYNRNTSESDSDYSFSDRKRKPKKKCHSPLFLHNIDHRSSKTNETFSESDEQSIKIKTKAEKGKSRKECTLVDNFEINECIKGPGNFLNSIEISKQGDYSNLKGQKNIVEREIIEIDQNNEIDLLPPKKFQIKKFELSQVDSDENQSIESVNVEKHSETLLKAPKESHEEIILNEIKKEEKDISTKVIKHKPAALNSKISSSSSQIDQMESSITSITSIIKKRKFEDNQFDSFQDAFIKTLQVENSLKFENTIDSQKLKIKMIDQNETKTIVLSEASVFQNVIQDSINAKFLDMENVSTAVVVTDNSEINVKFSEVNSTNDKNVIQPFNDNTLNVQNTDLLVVSESSTNKFIASIKESNKLTISMPPIQDVKVTVPVKKREKPRIIENVALKEPMILKTKLMEKNIGKIGKHKLETNNLKLNEAKCFPRTKVMKMETLISNSISRLPTKSVNENLTVTKKVSKTLTNENGSLISSLAYARSEQANATPQVTSELSCNEKYIQQSSQSLVDMDLDITSMPFVLSEDVLTPESIEQMPVVISSVLPATNTITTSSKTVSTTLITPIKQFSANQSFEPLNDIIELNSKKKIGMPTILKNKSKTKPMITSIKTIVPPLTSGCKGGYKMNTQTKTSLASQKTPGKYVIVQTSGHQQAYSTHQKVTIPTSKSSGNAQIVQQGSKVVILTSAQSGQSTQKVFPFNSITKAINSGKVQRIVTTKHGQHVYTPISSQSFTGAKTVLTPKSGDFSPNTSGQKILGHQQMTSKSVLTQLPGTIAKSSVPTGLPQGILTKEGIFTPINTSTLGGKTIISSKTLVAKGFPTQNIVTSKNILSPIAQSFSGKTIISSQGLISKGTVLTPITGSQVKALAAKNIKVNKMQHQTVQHKIQSAGSQKSLKVPISSLSKASSNLKISSDVVVLQNTVLKTVTPSKKNIKQVVQKPATTVLSPSAVMTLQQKGKAISTNAENKIVNLKNINKSIKVQEKATIEKYQENVQLKKLITSETSSLHTKIIEQAKQIETVPITKSNKGAKKNLQKKFSNTINSTILSSSDLNTSFSTFTPLEPISHEKIPKIEIPKEEIPTDSSRCMLISQTENIEEPKVSTQAQIMALPTENSDGTQTYVLVTVDEQGQIIPLDNQTLMSLDGTANFDGSRTVYIDSTALGESGSMHNIVLQLDNAALTNLQTTSSEPNQAEVTEILPTSEITQTANQDILAAALANTDFQHEISVTEAVGLNTITSLTQTSLINQTILQSTIIPPTEPISSPLVLETSLTLNQPIMTPLEVPSSLSIQSEFTPSISTTTMSTSLEMPITTANQNITYVTTAEPSLQISENLMPEGENTIKTSLTKEVNIKIPSNRQCAIEPSFIQNITNETATKNSKSLIDTCYSISIPEDAFHKKQIQTTLHANSMPLIDDNFNSNNGFDSSNASVVVENNLRNFVSKTSEELIQDLTGNDSSQDEESLDLKNVSNEKTYSEIPNIMLGTPHITLSDTQDDSVSSQQHIVSLSPQTEEVLIENNECSSEIHPINKEVYTVSSESYVEVQSSHEVQKFVATDQSCETTLGYEEQSLTSNQERFTSDYQFDKKVEIKSLQSMADEVEDKPIELKGEQLNLCQTSCVSAGDESNHMAAESKVTFEDKILETSQEAPSQSYEQLVSATSGDSMEFPSQSANKYACSQEATQSLSYEIIEAGSKTIALEPPSQSYKDSKQTEATESYKTLNEINTNTPSQSFHELIEVNEEKIAADQTSHDPTFPTQSYKIENIDNFEENMDTDTEISQEGNAPSQSNDIIADEIGTSSMTTNNSGVNEDETASSSYVPETPENQERDQDQESAISTSSYEILPCEELNIGSSSVIPDTSVQSEHLSMSNNSITEIATSSYSLNPDSSSTHVDAVPTSSYEDQIVVEPNVSTSYEIPISIANLEETNSQDYVTDSTDNRNEQTSYFPHQHEITDSYYEIMCKQSDSGLEANSEKEATPCYYETNCRETMVEASQNYLNQEEATPSYNNDEISPSYYDPQMEGEASQSYYSSHRSSQSVLQNMEATQSFYQENITEQLRQGEATPTYTDRYSLDYASVNSPLDRHDLVESSVPRSMDR